MLHFRFDVNALLEMRHGTCPKTVPPADRIWPIMRSDGLEIVASAARRNALPPPLFPAVHEIATGNGPRLPQKTAGRKIARFKKPSGGNPMQSKAQIDKVLRQKSDAVEIP